MKSKNDKILLRTKINTGLFFLLAIVFGIMTFCGVNRIRMFSRNFIGISDAPALCYDEETYKNSDSTIRQNTYPCSSQSDENGNPIPATSQNDNVMFLFNQVSFSGTVLTNELITSVVIIGSMLTLASLAAGIIYWNHNR